jgi:hypothetical protein
MEDEMGGTYNTVLLRSRRRWNNNSRKYLREIRWEDVDWIHLVQDRDQCRALVNTVMNLQLQ